jgi:hypothetical protein
MNWLLNSAYFIVNTVIAVLGPAILGSLLRGFVRPRSGISIILTSWAASIIFAGLLGALATLNRTTETACWAWVLPSLFFAFGAVVYLLRWRTGFIAHFSGYECAIGLQSSDCQDFLVFTVTLIRGIAYSAGARLLTWVSTDRKVTPRG